ncbi:MAG: nitroreductase [Methanosaeta sp. NSM2]|nr:nitroreductase family protein [Methanothrix sp.]OYV12042.1 MAG: nitroreductase [Methanosaeta sp. NSM2]
METIIVDRDLCTRCGICSDVCPSKIIIPGDGSSLPLVGEENAAMCLQCGHCEAFCPTEALALNLRPEERMALPEGAGEISPERIAFYLKKRRSIRHFTADPVPKEKILAILEVASYAASGGNSQPVQWLVVHDPQRVKKIAALTMEWMKSLQNTSHPISSYIPMLFAAWDKGIDVICQGAPHLLLANIPEGNPIAPTDAIIALTYVDIAAPAYGVGTCWAGFVAGAAAFYEPLQKELGLPAGHRCGYAMMLGYPKYKVQAIPRRKPLQVAWH